MRQLLARHRPSPAMVVACIALFVALGGTGWALARNSVGHRQIKTNAVRAPEVRANAIRNSELRDNAVGPGEVQDNSLGSGDVADDSLNASDIDGGSLEGEIGPDAFARIAENGTLQPNVAGYPPQVKGVDAGDVVKGEAAAATGNYCFGNLPGQPSSAQVTLDNADAAAADRNLVASVAIDRGQDLNDCPATHNQARVRIVDGNTGNPQDARFFIWFELAGPNVPGPGTGGIED
jgi:hypothetical protein